jgi:hypothetical protein
MLKYAAAGISALALPDIACAQSAPKTPAKPVVPGEHSVTAPVSIEVKARLIPSFDPRNRSQVRFDSLEYRSGLVLTSPFPGFGGLSAIRLDPKG